MRGNPVPRQRHRSAILCRYRGTLLPRLEFRGCVCVANEPPAKIRCRFAAFKWPNSRDNLRVVLRAAWPPRSTQSGGERAGPRPLGDAAADVLGEHARLRRIAGIAPRDGEREL